MLASPGAEHCASADQLAAYVGGELESAERLALDGHLDACARCRRAVSALAGTASVAITADDDGPAIAIDLAPGQRLGRFTVTRLLGHGAMGEVWAARDPELQREVALKLLRLRSELLTEQSSARLRREAQAMARLNHPNVVSIYELGTADDRVFCAMELVDGDTLRAWLATRRSWRTVLEVAVAIGRGLAAAHAAGLVHRDVKPENVLMARDGRTLVTDFGLAKLVGSLDEPSLDGDRTLPGEALTATGMLIGTPAYMAPEQLARGSADAHSDQFSYCVMVYEALFGVRPFVGVTIGELRTAIASGMPKPADLHGVPRRVVRALARGLAPDPRERWPSLDALCAELARAMRSRRGWLAGVAVVAVAAAATAVMVTRSGESSQDRARVAAEHRLAESWNPARSTLLRAAFVASGSPVAAERAETVNRALDGYSADWLAQRVDAWAATHVRGEQTVSMLERRVACFDRLADSMGDLVTLLVRPAAGEIGRAADIVHRLEPVSTCSNVSRLLAQPVPPSSPAGQALERDLRRLETLQVAGRHAEALDRAEALIQTAEAVRDPALQARARYNHGVALANAGRAEAAEAALRRALQDAAAARDHYLVAATWIRLLGVVGLDRRRPNEATDLEPAVRAAVAQAGDDPRQRADLEFTIGLAAFGRGDFAAARDRFVEALERRTALYGPDHPVVANTESNLAAMLMHLGELDEATRLLDHALATAKRMLGERHPLVANIEQNLAAIATRRKDWASAETHLRTAIAVMAVVFGSGHPELGKLRYLLATALREQKRFDAAREQLQLAREGLAIGPELIRLDLGAAQIAEAEGNWPEAERLARQAVTAMRASDAHFVELTHAIAELARMVAHRSPREALPIYEEALTRHVSLPSRDESGDVETLEELAQVALAAHRPAAALAWFDRMPKAAAALAELRSQVEHAK